MHMWRMIFTEGARSWDFNVAGPDKGDMVSTLGRNLTERFGSPAIHGPCEPVIESEDKDKRA